MGCTRLKLVTPEGSSVRSCGSSSPSLEGLEAVRKHREGSTGASLREPGLPLLEAAGRRDVGSRGSG